MIRLHRMAFAVALALMATSCTHGLSGQNTPRFGAPRPDSATVLLWHLDELSGTQVADAGPRQIHAAAGADTRIDFGRFRSARVFTTSVESFLYAPYDPDLESPDAMTLEAWIFPTALGQFEDTPIACRWTELGIDQSWLFALVGKRLTVPTALGPSPGLHLNLVALGQPAHLMFALQPEEPSPPLIYFSAREIELSRWTRIKVTFDSHIVRFYIDGLLDSQYALEARIRPSRAPIVVGNYIDPRWLSDFGGTWRAENATDRTPYYAFQGLIDELHISSVPRDE